jgi:hypothetical protein
MPNKVLKKGLNNIMTYLSVSSASPNDFEKLNKIIKTVSPNSSISNNTFSSSNSEISIDSDNSANTNSNHSDGNSHVVKDGHDGRDGKDGLDGKDGYDGKDGKDGKDGIDGKDGKDGKDGEPGKDGRDGHDGKDGEDGQSPKINFSNTQSSDFKFSINKRPIFTANKEKTKLTSYSHPKSSISIDKDVRIRNNGNLIFTADGDNVSIGSNGNVKINGKVLDVRKMTADSIDSASLSITGGRSKHNKQKNKTEFNNKGRNQISGDTTLFGNLNLLGDVSVAKDRTINIGNFVLKDKGTSLVIMNNKGDELKTIPLKKGNETLKLGKFQMKEMKRGLAFLNENGEEVQKIAYAKKHKFTAKDVHLRDNMRRDNKLFSDVEKLACIGNTGKVCGGKVKEWVDPQLID